MAKEQRYSTGLYQLNNYNAVKINVKENTVTKNKVDGIRLYKKPLNSVKQFSCNNNLPQAQRGAVLMEFVVITGLVLVPLFIGLIFIGKYTDNAQKIEVAARYSAWERTAWYQKLPKSLKKANKNINTEKSATELGFELQNRVFSKRDSAIYLAQKTNKVKEDDDL